MKNVAESSAIRGLSTLPAKAATVVITRKSVVPKAEKKPKPKTG
jgi:hypothetical protein